MKKNFKKILIAFICLFVIIPISFAANEGGTGGGANPSGGASGAGCTCMPYEYWQAGWNGPDGIAETAAYRFDLVYRTQNSGREILKTVIVQIPSRSYNSMWDGAPSQSLIRAVQDYNDAVNKTNTAKYGSKYVTSGPLADLANELLNGRTIDEMFGSGLDADTPENKKRIEDYLTSSEGFDVDKKDLQKAQSRPGNINSYGYRILIQKIVQIQNCCVEDYYMWRALTRKDAAGNTAVKRYLVGDKWVDIAPGQTKAAGDIFTTMDDINIKSASHIKTGFESASQGQEINDKFRKDFEDPNNGAGYNILWFSTDPFRDYDYSIDAACVNCSATGFENKAYVIQDTTNWEAILASPEAKVNNAKNYYNKGNNVFCREEYTVKFPDLTGHVKVNTGRYFTVNATNEELSTVSTLAPNFKPITVTRTRQCKSSTNDVNALNNFERNSRSTFKDNAGTVKLKYTEYNKNNSEYSRNSITLEPDEKAANTYSSNVSNNMLTMTQTVSYTLDDNVYRYIRLEDGLSIFDPSGINEDDLNLKYRDVGVANLPISFENETEGGAKIADVQLTYELPSDPNSKIKDAYKMNNNYFSDPSNPVSENIYKKAINAGAISNNSIVKGSLTDAEYEELTQSACAKLYRNSDGSYASGLYNCVNNRTSNKIGNNNDCIVQNDLSNSNSGYICPVTRDENTGICRIENGKYYLGDGTEVSKEEYERVCPDPDNPGDSGDTCRIENGKYYDFDGNEITKEEYERICPNPDNPGDSGDTCRIENGKYYDFDGNEITKEEYERICPATPYCPEDECPYGCCPSGECAPMPDGTCPGLGGKDVIYRTIDLNNPFPGQDAEQRNTGANWCSYNIKTQKIDCSYNNKVVQEYVTDENTQVYDDEHILYEVTLDADTIRSIRNYNDDNRYDDWKLSCRDNGRACFSDFLKDQIEVTGKCANKASKDAFYNCDMS